MNTVKKALYFFCMKEPYHYVGRDVFYKISDMLELEETDLAVDGYSVMRYRDDKGNLFYFMRQDALVSYEFKRFLPILKDNFSDFDIAGEVNWHEGNNAPDRVLTVHSIGDVEKGYFSPAAPRLMKNLLVSLEKHRTLLGLEDYTVTTEGTHWTGSIKGGDPSDIPQFPVPMVDIEIGSTPESWENELALETIAGALVEVFDNEDELVNILCAGGTHFADCFARPALDTEYPFGVSHILPNQWLVSGKYETEDGLKKLNNCVDTIPGGIGALFYHEGINGPLRKSCRDLGERLEVPVFKHKRLRKPDQLDIWK
jgi:D-tyrosyl-tRNA(Tyr) deacylase